MFLARRNLFQDKTRFTLSVMGVALAIMLILLLNGILNGIYAQISAYYDNTPGSVVVTQEGITASIGVSSFLPRGTADTVRQMGGVAQVIPILSQYMFFDLHERKVSALLIGYDPKLGGGPWRFAEGREPEKNDEIVIDRVLAQRHGIAAGDVIDTMGLQFKVVGLSEGTSSVLSNYVFIRKAAVEALLFAPEITSFLLVTPAAGTTPETLRDRLSDLPGLDALLKGEVTVNNRKLFDRLFGAPVQLMVGIAFLVGTLVVGLVIYTASIERQREYGLLKAIGARNRMLYRVVMSQAFIAAVAGALTGIGLALGAGRLIMALRPEFLVTLEPAVAASALLVGLAMALLAALIPAHVLAGLAPAEIFRR